MADEEVVESYASLRTAGIIFVGAFRTKDFLVHSLPKRLVIATGYE